MLNQGKPFSTCRATLKTLVLPGRGPSVIKVTLEDEEGKTLSHSYGATYQGQARRELGRPYEDAIGDTFDVSFGVNGHVTTLTRFVR